MAAICGNTYGHIIVCVDIRPVLEEKLGKFNLVELSSMAERKATTDVDVGTIFDKNTTSLDIAHINSINEGGVFISVDVCAFGKSFV